MSCRPTFLQEDRYLIEDLLLDLAESGWRVSYAYQHPDGQWRVSLSNMVEWNGYDQPSMLICVGADAQTFTEALEDAMSKRSEAELVESSKINHSQEPKTSLITALGLRSAPIRRRV